MADYLAGFYPEWVDKEENPRQIILDLGKMITNRIPVKLGFQKLNKYDPEYWGLATLLTDEQAEVALKMGVRKPKTMEDMVRRDFLPALMTYTDEVAASISAKKAVLATLPCTAQEKLLTTLSGYYEAIYTAEEKLEADLATAEGMTDQPALSLFYHETILSDMDAVRSAVDAAETYIPDSILPYPNYEKLLFSV